MRWLDDLPLGVLLVAALLLGLAPFVPEPHLLERGRMLLDGTLARPLDVVDLLFHGALPVLAGVRLSRDGARALRRRRASKLAARTEGV